MQQAPRNATTRRFQQLKTTIIFSIISCEKVFRREEKRSLSELGVAGCCNARSISDRERNTEKSDKWSFHFFSCRWKRNWVSSFYKIRSLSFFCLASKSLAECNFQSAFIKRPSKAQHRWEREREREIVSKTCKKLRQRVLLLLHFYQIFARNWVQHISTKIVGLFKKSLSLNPWESFSTWELFKWRRRRRFVCSSIE